MTQTSIADEPEALVSSPQIHVEPWPAGGWAVRLEGHPVPVSRHDTEEEARFRAAAYQRALDRGHKLALRRTGTEPEPVAGDAPGAVSDRRSPLGATGA